MDRWMAAKQASFVVVVAMALIALFIGAGAAFVWAATSFGAIFCVVFLAFVLLGWLWIEAYKDSRNGKLHLWLRK